jgi:hypothetical protein
MLQNPIVAIVWALFSTPIAETQSDSRTNPFAAIQPSKDLDWIPCFENTDAAKLGQIFCARLIVCAFILFTLSLPPSPNADFITYRYKAPLDYTNSTPGEVQLAIIKLKAAEQGDTHRSVFVNPGGPGEDP